jgi:hypothetical protein
MTTFHDTFTPYSQYLYRRPLAGVIKELDENKRNQRQTDALDNNYKSLNTNGAVMTLRKKALKSITNAPTKGSDEDIPDRQKDTMSPTYSLPQLSQMSMNLLAGVLTTLW